MNLLALLLLVAPTTSAAQEPQSGSEAPELAAPSVARFRLRSEPGGFDPVLSSQMIDAIMQRQVLETLTEYDYLTDAGTVHGMLAESWKVSEDGLTWIFTLHQDATFHDPFDPPLWPSRRRPLVAKDVVYSWLRMADARNPSEGFWAMEGVFAGLDDFREKTAALDPTQAEKAFQHALESGVEGIRALDDQHLQVRLLQKDPHFPQRVAMTHFEVYPFEAVTAEGRSMLDQPVGSAPFVIASWIPGQTIILARTPDWRGQESPFGDGTLPFLDRVEFHTVRDEGTAQNLFEKGEIDRLPLGSNAIAHFLDQDFQLKPEFAKRGLRLHDYSLPDVTMLCFGMDDPIIGMQRGDDPGNAKRRLLRQAVALVFPYRNWGKIIRGAAPAIPARNFLPPLVPGSLELEASAWNRTDLELAAQLLATAGHPGGEGLPALEYLSGGDSLSKSIAELFQATAAEIGIELELVTLPYHEQLQRQRSGQAQIFLRAWILDWPDAALILQTFYGPFAGTDTNLCGFRDQEYDTIFRRLRAAEDGPERQRMTARLLAILEREVPATAIDHRRTWMLTQPWLSNFRAHPFEILATRYFRITPH